MNKHDLVTRIAGGGWTKAEASKAIEATLKAITEALKDSKAVRISGFGTFSVTKRPAIAGRNPRTGEPIRIPPAKLPRFRPGKTLKEALNA